MSEDICEGLNSEKKVLCENVVDKHAHLAISTKEAEKQLSELREEPVVMVAPPEAMMPVGDPNVLEAWSMALCSSWKSDDKVVDACQDSIAKWIKDQKKFDVVVDDIHNLTGLSAKKIEEDMFKTCPCGAGAV